MQAKEVYWTDLRDEQWQFLEPLLPDGGSRPPKYSRRRMLNAMLYQARAGCSWRLLPANFPPWNNVRALFSRWRDQGVIKKVHPVLRDECRPRAGRHAAPLGGHLGWPERQDQRKRGPRGYGRLRLLWCDRGYWGAPFATWVRARWPRVQVQAFCRNATLRNRRVPGQPNWGRLPRRCVVERTFAWLGRWRRTSKDDEADPRSSETWLPLAMIGLMLRRLEP